VSHSILIRLHSVIERCLPELRVERLAASGESVHTQVAIIALLTGVAYYLGSKLGFALTFASDPISVLWAPNSLLMVALILSPIRSWWMIMLVVFPVHLVSQLQSHVPFPMIFAWFISNCSEAMLGAVCIRWFNGGTLRFDSVRQVSVFLISAGCVAPLLSSFLDAAFVQMNDFSVKPYWDLVWTRFLSNSVAALTIVPAIVILVTNQTASVFKASPLRCLEYGVLFGGLIIANFLVFFQYQLAPKVGPIFFYSQLPFLLWAALRFGSAGVSTAIVALVAMAIWGTSAGGGPFVHGSPEESARSIQHFLIIVIVLLMILTAIVAEREQSRESLRESKQLNAIATIEMGIWGWNPPAEEIWATLECRVLFGWPPVGTITIDALIDRIHTQEQQTTRHALQQMLREKGNLKLETRILLPDGNVRWIVVRARVVDGPHNQPPQMLGVCVDVTSRKTSELAAKKHLNEIAHMTRVSTMDRLATSLSHELNQPLTAILSNTQAAQRFLLAQPPDIAEVHAILKDIVDANRRASAVIGRMRVLVRKGNPEFTLVDLGEIMSDVEKLVHGDAVLRSVRVVFQCDPSMPRVRCDPIQLQQVTLNLLVNAFDAMGDVPMSEREVIIRVDGNGADSVTVMISDKGIGLADDTLIQIFNPFYTTKSNGLGMGLNISQSIIEAHGGRLWAENNAYRGATFYFTLPVSGTRASALSPA
jgi:signal transduction histidine kinase